MFEYSKSFFIEDPCKKCLVRACCTCYCKEKREFSLRDNCFPLWFNRVLVISLWTSILALPITIIIGIFDVIK